MEGEGGGVPILNFERGPGVLLLNFQGGPGVPLLNFEESSGFQGPKFPSPEVLVPLLHHAHLHILAQVVQLIITNRPFERAPCLKTMKEVGGVKCSRHLETKKLQVFLISYLNRKFKFSMKKIFHNSIK